jgi:hypothetical protein
MNGAPVLASICTGPNRACRAAHKTGRSVHVIPENGADAHLHPRLIMPTYHYRTSAEGIEAIAIAEEIAPTVTNDADLERYRAEKVAHYLPVGWCDPTMRRGSDRNYPRCLCGHALCFMDRQSDDCPACDRQIVPYLRLDNDFRAIDPSVPAGFVPMSNGLVPVAS